jgi:hypothetical protein
VIKLTDNKIKKFSKNKIRLYRQRNMPNRFLLKLKRIKLELKMYGSHNDGNGLSMAWICLSSFCIGKKARRSLRDVTVRQDIEEDFLLRQLRRSLIFVAKGSFTLEVFPLAKRRKTKKKRQKNFVFVFDYSHYKLFRLIGAVFLVNVPRNTHYYL